jgi:fatty acid-binding protein DegV
VEKTTGKYENYAQARSFEKALQSIVDHIAARYAPGTRLRAQGIHAFNLKGADLLRERMSQVFQCAWLPTSSIAPVLGAHTGPSLVGIAFAPLDRFPEIP